MRIFKNLFFVFFAILFPIVCFSHTIDKPYLVIKINTESLVLDNTNIKGAHMVENDNGSYNLDVALTSHAANQLYHLSEVNKGKTMSIFYGADKLVSKAIIQTSLGSEFQISAFPQKEGRDLINSLKNNQLEEYN